MATYSIEPQRATLHGHFSTDLQPALMIKSGDTVVFKTLEAGWWIEPPKLERVGDGGERRKFDRDPERGGGHALCGPVYIEGAEPGMTLQIDIEEVRPGPWGETIAGGWETPVNRRLGVVGQNTTLIYELDADRMVGRNQLGREVKLRPFMGVMGMPPPEKGTHMTPPPRISGGNIDCKELVAGTTLYLPIPIKGGLFSTGDGHALQGDGEVATFAIECPMERVRLTLTVLPDIHITTPRARTSEGWLTLGFDEDLDDAMFMALEGMLQLMMEQHGLSRTEALALASALVDLRVTQIVNGVKGVHAVLPHGTTK